MFLSWCNKLKVVLKFKCKQSIRENQLILSCEILSYNTPHPTKNWNYATPHDIQPFTKHINAYYMYIYTYTYISPYAQTSIDTRTTYMPTETISTHADTHLPTRRRQLIHTPYSLTHLFIHVHHPPIHTLSTDTHLHTFIHPHTYNLPNKPPHVPTNTQNLPTSKETANLHINICGSQNT